MGSGSDADEHEVTDSSGSQLWETLYIYINNVFKVIEEKRF
jgi:hypothetical protein